MLSWLWNPEVGVGALGNVVAAIILAVGVPIFGARKPIHRWLKAMRVKRYKGLNFGVLVCDLRGDKAGNVSRLVRSELASLKFESHPNTKTFKIEHFPLSLSSLNDGSERASIEKAKAWLRKTEYDVIIWGEYIEEAKVTVVKVMGAHGSAAEPIEVMASVKPKQFTEIMAEAVSREVVELASRAYSEPSKVPVEILRDISKKIDRLLASNMSWFSVEEAKRVRFAINKLQTQICFKSASFEDWRRAEINARYLVALSNKDVDPEEWIETVYDYSRHALRKASVGLDPRILQDAIGLMEKAIGIIQTSSREAPKAKYLAACRKWLSAYQDRDTSGMYQAQSFDDAFAEFQQATREEGKDLHYVYLASIYPEQFSQKIGLGTIKCGWMQKMWDYTARMEVDDYLAGLVLFELVDTVARSENSAVRNGVGEEAFLYIKNMMSRDSDQASFIFKQMRFSYIILANRLLDAHGLTVFVERLGTPDIIQNLNSYSDDVYMELTSGKNERDYYSTRAERLGFLKTTLASVTNEVIYYRQAEDLFLSLSHDIGNFNADRRKTLVNQRCSALNNWGVLTKDVSLFDRSYSILMSETFADGYTQYLVAYMKYAKANVSKANAFGNETETMKATYRNLMNSALEHCGMAKKLRLDHQAKVATNELSQAIKNKLSQN
ncbi:MULTISPECIES: hypothetical protein [unclassified Rhizobium]|uniref:hypothetical protein n=1 Tax=unclassified Rhizobium TaxID=2613769 RepID=UPI00288B7A65|nr:MULTISPECIES: hypothetical protein [unclassified Rhizobium]